MSVIDTGIGISQDKLDHIFRIFNSVLDRAVNPQGTGLGLNISNILAKELGHSPIKVTSKEGRGSVFSFKVCIDCSIH